MRRCLCAVLLLFSCDAISQTRPTTEPSLEDRISQGIAENRLVIGMTTNQAEQALTYVFTRQAAPRSSRRGAPQTTRQSVAPTRKITYEDGETQEYQWTLSGPSWLPNFPKATKWGRFKNGKLEAFGDM